MKHHYHSPYKRGFFSFLLISMVMLIGTTGMHLIEKITFLDAFYFMSMIATAQGPTIVPITWLGKVFASLMAFVSVGVVVTSIGFLFGPFFGKLWHIGAKHMEEEMRIKNKEEREP